MDLGIAGRRAAVAAASRGLGLGVARALAAEGVHVALCGRDAADVERAAAAIGAVGLVEDVSRTDGARRFVEDAAAALGGPVDILVANGGGPPRGTWAETPLDRYAPAIERSLLSVVAMCEAAVPPMRARGWGRVLAITSIAVRQPIPNLILSNTARAGTTGFLRTLAREVAEDGVTVNSIQPGLHATGALSRAYTPEEARAAVPVGTLGDPDDFGRVAVTLCAEHARFVTGVALQVDGGAYAGLL